MESLSDLNGKKSSWNSQGCIFNAMKSSCKFIVHAPNVNMSSKADDDKEHMYLS